MEKPLITVGNSKAIIIPAELIKKYNVMRFLIEERSDGILLRPVENKDDFEKRLEEVKKNKKYLYRKMLEDASEPDTAKYYKENDLSNIDTDIID